MKSAFDPALARRIESTGIIAVLVIDRAEDAVPLAQSLLAGGVNILELTLRTPVALDALAAIREEVPDMVTGVGTILSPAQVGQVVERGGAFGVSPGLNPRVLAAAQEAGLSFAPGIVTPSDIEQALGMGCRTLKFFPAEPSGGLPYLKAISAPYAHLGVQFIPLGGIDARNMITYLEDPAIPAIGGSWLAPRALVAGRNWEAVTLRAAEASGIIRSLRGDRGS